MESLIEILGSNNLISVLVLLGLIVAAVFKAWEIMVDRLSFLSKIKEKRIKKKKNELDTITKKLAEELTSPIMEKIESANEEQNKQIEKLIHSSNDMLRSEILKIYFKYQDSKKIPQYQREQFEKLYNDYIAQGGNSFVSSIYPQVITWQIVSADNKSEEA